MLFHVYVSEKGFRKRLIEAEKKPGFVSQHIQELYICLALIINITMPSRIAQSFGEKVGTGKKELIALYMVCQK